MRSGALAALDDAAKNGSAALVVVAGDFSMICQAQDSDDACDFLVALAAFLGEHGLLVDQYGNRLCSSGKK